MKSQTHVGYEPPHIRNKNVYSEDESGQITLRHGITDRPLPSNQSKERITTRITIASGKSAHNW